VVEDDADGGGGIGKVTGVVRLSGGDEDEVRTHGGHAEESVESKDIDRYMK
jgi:hypothetical protein